MIGAVIGDSTDLHDGGYTVSLYTTNVSFTFVHHLAVYFTKTLNHGRMQDHDKSFIPYKSIC